MQTSAAIRLVVCAAIASVVAGCEGKQRYYPDIKPGQGGAPPAMSIESAMPPLQPGAASGAPSQSNEMTSVSSRGGAASSDRPSDIDGPEDAARVPDAGGGTPTESPMGCNCSATPDTPLCNATGAGNPALINTCVECLSSGDCADDPAASRCDPSTGRCGACRVDDDCSLFAGTAACSGAPNPHCVECVSNAQCSGNLKGAICNQNTCVECVADADCPSASASRCVANQCQPCVDDAAGSHCSHISSNNTVLGVCDESGAAGVCVQCTGTQSAACGGSVCNGLTKQCSLFRAATASRCQPCVSDAQCSGNTRCVLEIFGSTPLDYVCMPLAQNGSCPLTPFSALSRVNTVDGAVEDACLMRRSTCAGYLDAASSCTSDDDCGEEGLEDGRCLTAPPGLSSDTGLLCHMPCSNGADCPSASDADCLGVCQL